MKFSISAASYRSLRSTGANRAQYSHLWYLAFWPVYVFRYVLVENLNPAASYHLIHSPLDDLIPFCEWFLIPYVAWYGFIVGMHLYTLFFDLESFKKYTHFMAISICISTTVFLLFPSCQNLRPTEFPRDNILTGIVRVIYAADTSTNILPSEHVIGSLAVFLTAMNTKSLRSSGKMFLIGVTAVLICMSTVFLKQHSVLDIVAALPVCGFSYYVVFWKGSRQNLF